MVGVAACGLCQLAFAVAWTVAPGSAAASKSIVAFISLFTFFYVAYGKFNVLGDRVGVKKLTVPSTIRLASWRRISQQSSSSIHLRPWHLSKLCRQLAGCLHGALLYQPREPGLECEIRVGLTPDFPTFVLQDD